MTQMRLSALERRAILGDLAEFFPEEFCVAGKFCES